MCVNNLFRPKWTAIFIFKPKNFVKCQGRDQEVEEYSPLSGFSTDRLCVFDQDTNFLWGFIKWDNNMSVAYVYHVQKNKQFYTKKDKSRSLRIM